MAILGGAVLRITATVLRAIQLLASILVLGVYSYFLAVQHDHNQTISTWERAVEGMSGAAVLYGFFCVFLTLCLGGISFFAFLAVVLDICFVACYVAIAYYNRHGVDSCNGYVITPLGSGQSNTKATSGEFEPHLGRACKLEKAVFAVSILNIVLFIVTALFQILLVRHHKREKRYGPSPANNYTSGMGRRPLWRRRGRDRNATRDAELATAGGALGAEKHSNVRPSDDTAYTGSTVQHQNGYGYGHPTSAAVNY